jgi:hypothetical protein
VRTLIAAPPLNRRPDSADPRVVVRRVADQGQLAFEGPAGWGQPRDPADYTAMVTQWRRQSPHYVHPAKVAGNEEQQGEAK